MKAKIIKSPSILLGRDKIVRTTTNSLNFTARGNRQRTQMHLALLPIERVGDTVFNLKLNGTQIASHVLTVRPNNKEAD